MRPLRLPFAGVLAAALLVPSMVQAQVAASSARVPVEVRIWLERSSDVPLQRGERSRVYYRAAQDAYVAVFRVDTDGVLRLLFPSSPQEEHRLRGGRDYRLLFQGAGDWAVEDVSGVGYFFALASPVPFDWGRFTITSGTGNWSLASTGVALKQDPHLAVNELAELLVGGESGRGYGLDFTSYHVGQTYSYPRFLCYQCHTAAPVAEWNPYRLACEDYRIVIYNDPYFYPTSRYQGTRVLYPLPPDPALPQFGFASRSSGEPGTPQVVDRSGTGGRELRILASQQGGNGTLVRQLEERGALLSAASARPTTAPTSESAVRGVVREGEANEVILPVVTPDRPTLQRRTSQPADR